MSNLLEWFIVSIICIVLGLVLIMWPLGAYITWDLMWFYELGSMSRPDRGGLLILMAVCALVVYGIVRYGYRE